MYQDYNYLQGIPNGSAEGTSLLTKILEESRTLGYDIWAVNTGAEKLYINVYGAGAPPLGYRNYARSCLYQDIRNNKVYQQVGTELSSAWAEIGVSGTVTVLDRFLQLLDTPDSYAGSEGKLVSVKADGTGLEFTDRPTPFTGLAFTQAERDKLNGIEPFAQVNEPFSNPCIFDAPFLEAVDGTVEPIPMALRSADTPVVIVDNMTVNGQYKAIYNDYKYATQFNVGAKDTITSVSINLELANSPNGTLQVGIYTVNAGQPDTVLVSGTGSVSGLVNGENEITFSSPVTVVPSTSYFLVVGVVSNTQGIIKWNEATTGTLSKVNINDEWLAISSNLTHKVMGYVATTGYGGLVPATGADDCVVGFATTNTASGGTGSITACGKICGFTGLIPFNKYYLATAGGITLDKTQTGIMVGIAVSTTCILIKTCGGAAVEPETFHIKVSETDFLGDGADNIDHDE